MKKTNFALAKGLGVVLLCAGANIALAETVSVPASVTVNNAIDFTVTGTLDFGQVRAVADMIDGNCTGLVMPANPASPLTQGTPTACTGGAEDAALQAVGGTPTRPQFTVTGTAPFTNLTLTLPLPTESVALTAATGPDTPQFFLSAFTAHKTSGTPGTIAPGADNLQTGATGEATFAVGATLGTHLGDAASANYQDLAYTGSFDVVVNY
jgi:hypothetical protein